MCNIHHQLQHCSETDKDAAVLSKMGEKNNNYNGANNTNVR